MTNIYISGLSLGINSDDLKDLFGEYGVVSSAKIITDRDTGKSKGFGFVEMESDEAGQKAINELNGAEYDEKTISVTVARPKPERSSGGYNKTRY